MCVWAYEDDHDYDDYGDDNADEMLVNLLEKIVRWERLICAPEGQQRVALWSRHLPDNDDDDDEDRDDDDDEGVVVMTIGLWLQDHCNHCILIMIIGYYNKLIVMLIATWNAMYFGTMITKYIEV